MTRSKKLSVMPCPSTGYTIKSIKNHIKSATIYIRPMQKDIDTTPVSFNEFTDISYTETQTVLKNWYCPFVFSSDDKSKFLNSHNSSNLSQSCLRPRKNVWFVQKRYFSVNLRIMSNFAGMHRTLTVFSPLHVLLSVSKCWLMMSAGAKKFCYFLNLL